MKTAFQYVSANAAELKHNAVFLDDQALAIQAHAIANAINIVRATGDVTDKKEIYRPGISEILEHISNDPEPVDFILVYSFDRITHIQSQRDEFIAALASVEVQVIEVVNSKK